MSWACRGSGVGRDEAPSDRFPASGSAPGSLTFPLGGRGLGSRIAFSPHCFFGPSHLAPRLPGRPTSPASLFRCLFSSKESACPPQGPKLPHCHLGLVHPRVSPSTSALSLVLSHRDWKRESAICRASHMPPHRWGRGLGKRQGSPQPWGLGALVPQGSRSCWSLS